MAVHETTIDMDALEALATEVLERPATQLEILRRIDPYVTGMYETGRTTLSKYLEHRRRMRELEGAEASAIALIRLAGHEACG